MGLSKTIPCVLLVLLLATTHIAFAVGEKSIYIVHIDKSSMPKIFASQNYRYTSMIDSIKNVGQASDGHYFSSKLLYTYDTEIHGFSALMSKDQLEAQQKFPGFISAYPDESVMDLMVDTTHTPDFLYLNTLEGLWPASDYGKDVIIGVIDGDVWLENPSFNDDRMTPILARWRGTYQAGVEFNSTLCNLELIGVGYFNEVAKAASPNENITMNSGRDIDVHGTHVAAIAVGLIGFPSLDIDAR